MHPLPRRKDDIRLQQRHPAINPIHVALHSLVPLKQPTKHIAHLRQGKLLPDADARPRVKGDVVVRLRVPVRPPLRAEDGRVGEGLGDWRVQVGAALHDEGRVADGRVFEDGEGFGAVGAAAAGESCVFEGEADVEGDGGVEA